MAAEGLLIVAACGRALAQSARRAGMAVQVVDGFADLDTRAAAAGVTRVANDDPQRDARVLAAAARMAPGGALVYGGGMEGRLALLKRLAEGRTLYGNAPAVVERVSLPVAFGRLLDRLAIAHPESRRRAPAGLGGWLLKREGGAGGTHVHGAASRPAPGEYYQRRVGGPVLSATFLADGRHARVVGYARQWCAPAAGAPYRYGGAVTLPRVAGWLRRQVEAAADALTGALGLRGLNGLDFVVHQGRPFVLELNPRPGATFELHERATGIPLLAGHLRACEGELPECWPEPGQAHAHAILYAREALCVPDVAWPAWSSDRAPAGTLIDEEEPLCTVHAQGPTPAAACTWLKGRGAWLERRLLVGRTAAPALLPEVARWAV